MTNLSEYTYVVIGAGFWGSVIAERIASVFGERVLVVDKRGHTGGNSHSSVDAETGIECHTYGTHIFHTRKERVWDYLGRFTRFNYYRHKVLTEHNGRIFPMPIGLATINAFYGTSLRPGDAAAFIANEAAKENIAEPANLEEKAISLIGRPLYEAFIKGYTWKQWQRDPRELPAAIITRLPVRTNYNPEYFDDAWQGQPEIGFHGLFDALLARPEITVRLKTSYNDIRTHLSPDATVFYTGAIDEFFDYSLGMLNWRSLRFEKETPAVRDFQGAAVINQADLAVPFTRTHEFRHLHPERAHADAATVIVREYPMDFTRGGDAYYPVDTPADKALLTRYRELAAATAPNVVFGGRLGAYRYMDMDVTVDDALTAFDALHAGRAARG
ncbi:NAD(P)-binding protein [Desulfovibrio sp. OttesenSCG-928-O18]|nr:NAD(P)-binding protein [Desulfovibrio sp. OttesenSCG-928-O18]